MPAMAASVPAAKIQPRPKRSESQPPSRFPAIMHAAPNEKSQTTVSCRKPRSTA
jgi:hypothetical protein